VKVTFYGTRGSVPVCTPNGCSEFGGNTSCILLTFRNGRIAILDAGTGIRRLGNDLVESSVEQFDNIFIALSHTHWDHIQGFPFFKPAYDPRRQFTFAIYGKDRKEKSLENVFKDQMKIELFPVPLEKMGASLSFTTPAGPTATVSPRKGRRLSTAPTSSTVTISTRRWWNWREMPTC
jgi:phosphoribosyl 1,2-cyclic phosphodiesterase